MKKIYYFIMVMSILSSCEKDDFYNIKDVTLVVGDSGNVKIKRLDIKIKNSGTYNIDVNNDGVNDYACATYYIDINDDGVYDFALYSFYYYHFYVTKGPVYYWSVKSLSENNKVLCDTISSSKVSYFIAPKPLFIKDTLSANDGLWYNSPPKRDPFGPPSPIGIIDYLYPDGGFLLFSYFEPYVLPLPPGAVKGGITWAEFSAINEKYIGLLLEKNGTTTLGWMMLEYNVPMAEVFLKEIGIAEFPLSR